MHNPRLAGRYAKSIIDLAVEKNQLDAVYADMKLILGICKGNPDFVAVLRSPIIKADKKGKIVASITSDRVSALTTAFITLLVNKGRETNLPEIAEAFVSQYNKIKHIQQVKITTAVPISAEMQQSIVASVNAASGNNTIELETKIDEALIGGFVLETEGNLVDASILKDLKDVKKQFLKNDYIHKLR